MNSTETTFKQVIVIRRKYPDGKGGIRKVRTGKMVAQACHASLLSADIVKNLCPDSHREWIVSGYGKVVVYVDSEDQLIAIAEQCKELEVPGILIQDAGRTEFNKPTFTAVGIGPWSSDQIDIVTGELPLL